MKRITIILGLFLILGFVKVVHAADLQAGWYANIPGINFYSYMAGSGQIYLRGDGEFWNTPAGINGPFNVTLPYSGNETIDISVPNSVSCSSNQTLIIPVTAGFTIGDRIAYIEMLVNTNYDPSQMYIQLWEQQYNGGPDKLIWEDKQSGYGGFNGYLDGNSTYTGEFYFKLNVVPEPSGMVCMLFGFVPIFEALRKRK